MKETRLFLFTEAFPDEQIVSAVRRQLTWTHLRGERLGGGDSAEMEALIFELGVGFAFLERQKRGP